LKGRPQGGRSCTEGSCPAPAGLPSQRGRHGGQKGAGEHFFSQTDRVRAIRTSSIWPAKRGVRGSGSVGDRGFGLFFCDIHPGVLATSSQGRRVAACLLRFEGSSTFVFLTQGNKPSVHPMHQLGQAGRLGGPRRRAPTDTTLLSPAEGTVEVFCLRRWPDRGGGGAGGDPGRRPTPPPPRRVTTGVRKQITPQNTDPPNRGS